MDLREWVNQGLMTLFFLVVGLEAKRELDLGQLRERRRIAIPVVAALGGMALPSRSSSPSTPAAPGAKGWGAAMSTDTAFALAVLALVAPNGTRVRVQMLTLAIVDDLVALSSSRSPTPSTSSFGPLLIAVGLFAVLRRRAAPIPARLLAADGGAVHRGDLGRAARVGHRPAHLRARRRPARQRLPAGARGPRARSSSGCGRSASSRRRSSPARPSAAWRPRSRPNERIQYGLHPWTSFVIVPLFALANTGVRIDGDLLSRAVTSPITLGIFFGYVVGKPVGITIATWLATRAAQRDAVGERCR